MAKKKPAKKKSAAKKAAPARASLSTSVSPAASSSSAGFALGDRVKVTRAGAWCYGYAGAVCQPDEVLHPGKVMVLLEAKAHAGAQPFSAADLVAA